MKKNEFVKEDEMADAFIKLDPSIRIGRLVKTGIRLKVIEKETGRQVNYGVQLNNTTLEIEALSNLIVTVRE